MKPMQRPGQRVIDQSDELPAGSYGVLVAYRHHRATWSPLDEWSPIGLALREHDARLMLDDWIKREDPTMPLDYWIGTVAE